MNNYDASHHKAKGHEGITRKHFRLNDKIEVIS